MSASEHADRIREALSDIYGPNYGARKAGALAALDALVAERDVLEAALREIRARGFRPDSIMSREIHEIASEALAGVTATTKGQAEDGGTP